MTLSASQQAIASNLGQEKTDPDNLVTLVRRRLALEEVVITKEQFEQYNKDVRGSNDFYWSQLDWKDAQWDDYCEEKTYYSAYQGDVTSFTDDVVSFMSPDPKYRFCYDQLELLNSDDFWKQGN